MALDLLKPAERVGGNNNDINPAVKRVPGGSPLFVFPGKSREATALRIRSLIFAPTLAKTVAIPTPFVDGQAGLCPIVIELLCEAVHENIERVASRAGNVRTIPHAQTGR